MDHKVSKDMISSGMIPSGEKTQADLSRTQYGTAPSPSKLMDAYKSMYDKKEEVINEHHKKDADGNTIPHEGEELNEGKIPAGLQAYLDKKKGKKEDKKDMKEQYDLVYEHFIGEGFSEDETYERMSNLTEEQLDEFMKMLAARAAQYGANLGQKTKIDAVGGIKRKPFEPVAQRKPFDAKPKPGEQGFKAKSASEVISSVHASRRKPEPTTQKKEEPKPQVSVEPIRRRKKEVMQDEYQYIDEYAQFLAKGAALLTKIGKAAKPVADATKKTIGNVAKNPTVQNMVTQTAVGAAMNSGGGTQKQRADKVSAGSYQASSADLFDIVKGQLLDEGLSEEEIKDIMLTLTPDEILSEYKDVPAGQMNYASYGVPKPKSYEMDSLKRQTAPGGGKDYKIEDKKNVVAYNQKKIAREEYKNFDPKKPDPKQMAAQAKQEKNRQKFNDPMGVKNKNIGGQGLDPMDK